MDRTQGYVDMMVVGGELPMHVMEKILTRVDEQLTLLHKEGQLKAGDDEEIVVSVRVVPKRFLWFTVGYDVDITIGTKTIEKNNSPETT